MNPQPVFGTMIVASVAVMLIAAHPPEPAPVSIAPSIRAGERPWLSAAAADQLVGPEGSMGPIFAGIDLGGPAPTPAQRARVDAFAKANAIEVRYEVVAHELVAVRFGVTFGGCCGYEGADTFARKLGRPWTQEYCTAPHEWTDDWSTTTTDGTSVRGRVRINRVEIRWEQTESFAELMNHAETLLGQPRVAALHAYGDRMIELEPNHVFLVEVPYAFGGRRYIGGKTPLAQRTDLGFRAVSEHGVITEVQFVLDEFEGDNETRDLPTVLEARWGKPRITTDADGHEHGTWHERGRTYTAEQLTFSRQLVLRAN